MHLVAVGGIRLRLHFMKGQLLVQQTLLKLELVVHQLLLEPVRDAWRQPDANESAKNCSANTGKEKFVTHRRVVMSANNTISRETFSCERTMAD
jgi:hypothetical protein